MPNNNPEKKRFSRGRRPGVPITEYPDKKSGKLNPNDRPGLQRFSVSLPVALARFVRALKPRLDLEYSKIFRSGLDKVIEEAYRDGKIDSQFYDDYWATRRAFRDEDWSGSE
jgi:hypothetical protein